jgi:hypothetical protein
MDSLWQTVIGAMSAVFGGFGGAWFIRWRDDKRAKRERNAEVVGVITVVLAELAENNVNLTLRIDSGQWLGRFQAFDQAYRDAEPLLGRELDWKALEELFKAYAPLRSPTWLYRDLATTPAEQVVGRVEMVAERAQELRGRIAAAAAALRTERAARGGAPNFPPP